MRSAPAVSEFDTSGGSAISGGAANGIRFEQVSKSFGEAAVLHDIDLEVLPGELVALVGPSGCGKTTMLRLIAGLDQVTSGRITIGGVDVATVPVERRDLGVVFQSYSLFAHLSVAKNVAFGLRMRRVASGERVTRIAEALELVGLGDFADRLPHTLSGGQQQRVVLARALVTRPRALLLDEPLSALDAGERERLREEIRSIQQRLGITTLFVTHDQDEALSIADRVAVMRGGRIEQFAEPEVLYRRPATPFVAGFIGESNRLMGEFVGSTVRVQGVELSVISGDTGDGGLVAPRQSAPVVAFVRPEHLRIEASPGVLSDDDQAHGAMVRSTSFLGAHMRTVVEFSNGELAAVRHETGQSLAPGQRVRVHFTGEAVAVGPR